MISDDLPTFDLPANANSASTTVSMSAKTTLTANAADTTKPVVTISKTDYNTYSWTATDGVGVVAYQITNSSTAPTASDANWTTITSTTSTTGTQDIDATAGKTYYVWAKDAAGNVSAAKSIT